jgi:hypothetical protein
MMNNDEFDSIEKTLEEMEMKNKTNIEVRQSKSIINEDTIEIFANMFKRMMNETESKGQDTRQKARSKEQDDTDKDERHKDGHSKAMDELEKLDKSERNVLLEYLKAKDELAKKQPSSVNTKEHFMEARHKREERQARLSAQMAEGRYIRHQRLLEQLDRRNMVREKLIREQNISSRGTAPSSVFPQNPIYQSSVGNV